MKTPHALGCEPYRFIGSNMAVACFEPGCFDHCHTPDDVRDIEILEDRPPESMITERHRPLPRFYCPKHSGTRQWLCRRTWLQIGE